MKDNKKALLVVLALVLALALSLGVFAACNQHVCQSKCDVCGKCTNLDCKEDACKEKCSGHGGPSGSEYTKDMNIGENGNSFSEYVFPERGADEKQVVIYWREAEHDYSDNDMWIWFTGADGSLYEMHECKYGAVVVVNVPSATTELNYIVRKNSTVHTGSSWGGDGVGKILPDDQKVTLTGDVTTIYLTGANKYQFSSTDGGKTLDMIKVISKMSISTMTQIDYAIAPATIIDDISKITVKCNGTAVEIESISSLNSSATSGTIKLKQEINLSNNYEVTIEGYGTVPASPMALFDSKAFGDKYNYDGDDLGAVITEGSVVFKVWAPTASKVLLNIYDKGNDGPDPQTTDMVLGDNGVWSYTVANKDDAVGKYYTYTVTTSEGTQEAVDPYAKSAGVNGDRGMVIDLNDTNPDGFADSEYIELASYTDAVLWETHVRDFSNNIASSQYKGKYLAFTETGLTNSAGIPVGVDYVKNLGITHIHLLPVFDYASVDESSSAAQFNWGYDPKNYNVPEGSYSTNATKGEVRVTEFKQMVQALHNQGLGVVMDMVYNHTFDKNSNLNKIVPYYYYRYNADGTISSGSGCGNDTASERHMFSKYMVDSVSYWVKEYKLDGLRFDLMGLHDLETMRAIEKAVHEINPNAIIYGEGWTMSTATRATLATQTNISRITASEGAAGAISVFNDAIRDGLRGSVFNATEQGFLGDKTKGTANVAFGIAGSEKGGNAGWTVKNGGAINYISAHDNHTLWDRLATNAPSASHEQRLAMNRMGAAIIMLSKGTPFMTAGEEMLRSKTNADGTFNENSYNASDAVNNLKWEALTTTSDEYAMMLYYKGLIEMRKSSDVLRANNGVTINVTTQSGTMVVTYTVEEEVKIVAVINNSGAEVTHALPEGNWSLVCNGTQAGAIEIAAASGEVTVPAGVVHVYFAK